MLETMRKESENIFYSTEAVALVSAPLIDELMSYAAGKDFMSTVRICFHKDVQEKLHEMLIVHPKCVDVPVHRHRDKSEVITVHVGEMDIVFFDQDKIPINTISCGPLSSGKVFQVYVPQGVWHSMLIHSAQVCFSESTTGPFIREAMEILL